jgi:hypothetical protein
MTAALLDRPISLTGQPVAGDGVTLEELLSATLRAAQTNGSTECPVCHARMAYTRAAATPAADCTSCGSRLS